MSTKLNSMASGVAGQFDHVWKETFGQGLGNLCLKGNEASFVASWTETVTSTNGSPIVNVTTVANAQRVRSGLTVTGAWITGGTATVLAVNYTTGDVTLSANANATGSQTMTFTSQTVYDHVIYFGYNKAMGGVEDIAGQGFAVWEVEGHYHRDSDDAVLMEAYLSFGINGAGGESRPIFAWYDKINKVPLSVDISPGATNSFNIYHQNYLGQSSNLATFSVQPTSFYFRGSPLATPVDHGFSFQSSQIYLTGTTTSGSAVVTGISSTANLAVGNSVTGTGIPANTVILSVDSATQITLTANATASGSPTLTFGSKSTYINLSANGDDAIAGNYSIQFNCGMSGTNNVNRHLGIFGRSATGVKTGGAYFRADNASSVNSILFSLGPQANSALATFDSQYMPTNYPTHMLKPVAGQTRGVIELFGLNNDNATFEQQKWKLMPKGYVTVRESGGSTDRTPGTGAQSVTSPTYTNKPGTTSPTGNPTVWVPFLTTSGALVWTPAWAD